MVVSGSGRNFQCTDAIDLRHGSAQRRNIDRLDRGFMHVAWLFQDRRKIGADPDTGEGSAAVVFEFNARHPKGSSLAWQHDDEHRCRYALTRQCGNADGAARDARFTDA
jgi:hypothetical protein